MIQYLKRDEGSAQPTCIRESMVILQAGLRATNLSINALSTINKQVNKKKTFKDKEKKNIKSNTNHSIFV